MLDRIRAVGVQLDAGAGERICETPPEVRMPRRVGWLEQYKVELLQLLQLSVTTGSTRRSRAMTGRAS
jgi:hypothetical protein